MADDAVTIKKSRSRKAEDAPVPVAAPDELVKTPRKLPISGSKGVSVRPAAAGSSASPRAWRGCGWRWSIPTTNAACLRGTRSATNSGYEGLAELDCFAMDI